jgi:hypothetical protein
MRTTSAPFKYYADWTERIAKGELLHSNLPQPSQLAPRDLISPTIPLSATLPPPAGRVRAAIHCTPLCYGPLPRDCRGALGAPPAGGAGRRAAGVAAPKDFYFSYPSASGAAFAPRVQADAWPRPRLT